jgi:HK97 gp10 family phage protein
MVSVTGTKGKTVQVAIVGITDVIRWLNKKGKQIENAVELELSRNAAWVASEVQESIIGRRSEPKSVDTGKFGNSIKVDKKSKDKYVIKSNVGYAQFLEHGTSKMAPRRHFGNTEKRVKPKVVANMRKVVKQAVKR